jgi:hypothetical protein
MLYIPGMWKAIAPVLLIVLSAKAQIPCPVRFISGDANQDSITLSFMNKGKVPVQQLNLSCTPPKAQTARGEVCHTENGLFYPGMQYSLELPYPGADRHAIEISLRTARVAGGVLWTSTRSEPCRVLRVQRKKRP